ncbi:MAG TPA: hypothetical protein VLM89_12260, partial [Phycisphaerae bacterium]|nr:hypothetical protein [Phycisphaerae bacterium]
MRSQVSVLSDFCTSMVFRVSGTLVLCLLMVPAVVAEVDPAELGWQPVSTSNLRIKGLTVMPAEWVDAIWLPADTKVLRIEVTEDAVIVNLSLGALGGLDEAKLTGLYNEFRNLFYDLPQGGNVRLMCKGQLLSSYIEPAPAVEPISEKVESTAAPQTYSLLSTSLGGKKICIGPSHGRLWNGTAWGWQRGDDCGFGEAVLEDTNSIRLMQFLQQYLAQDGATVYVPRQMDETVCCHPGENRYWWQIASYSWLYHMGYPCSVWASNTGSCTSDTGPNRYNDDIR